jgi:hypothetical protein
MISDGEASQSMLAEDLGELSGGENKDDYKAGYERLLS